MTREEVDALHPELNAPDYRAWSPAIAMLVLLITAVVAFGWFVLTQLPAHTPPAPAVYTDITGCPLPTRIGDETVIRLRKGTVNVYVHCIPPPAPIAPLNPLHKESM